MKPISQAALARALEVPRSSVQAAIRAGRITWPAVDVETARAEWIATSGSQGPAPLADRDDTANPGALAAAKLRREQAKAALEELKLARERGEVIPAAELEADLAKVFSAARAHLWALPSRVRAAGFGQDVADVVEQVVREALEELARGVGGKP